MAIAFMTFCALIFIVGRHTLPHFYIEDPEVISVASTLLVIAALFQLSDGAQVVCISALRGLQDVKIPSLLIFICYWIISLPLGYVLAFKMDLGAVGIWLGLFIGLTLTAIVMFIRFQWLVKSLSVSIAKK
jgi:MATE family multidrug resistance protein